MTRRIFATAECERPVAAAMVRRDAPASAAAPMALFRRSVQSDALRAAFCASVSGDNRVTEGAEPADERDVSFVDEAVETHARSGHRDGVVGACDAGDVQVGDCGGCHADTVNKVDTGVKGMGA